MPNRFEEMGAKGVGAMKGLVGAIKGLHGVFNTLVQQHGETAALLERAKLSKDAEKRSALWATIREELLSHERGELDVVYPAFRQHAELVAIATEHEDEANELEGRILALDALAPASDEWATGLERLVTLVKEHVGAEEHDWFPKAAPLFSKEESEELDRRFKVSKRAAAEKIT